MKIMASPDEEPCFALCELWADTSLSVEELVERTSRLLPALFWGKGGSYSGTGRCCSCSSSSSLEEDKDEQVRYLSRITLFPCSFGIPSDKEGKEYWSFECSEPLRTSTSIALAVLCSAKIPASENHGEEESIGRIELLYRNSNSNNASPPSPSNQMQKRLNQLARGLGQVLKARKETEQMKAQLHKTKTRFKETLQLARLGLWDLDLTTGDLYWSEEVYQLFRLDPGKFGASYEAFVNAIHPDDREMVDKAFKTSLEKKEPYDIVHRLLFEDGSIKYVNEICRNEFDRVTGEPLRSVGTVQDVTERMEFEHALQESEKLLKETQKIARMGHWKYDLKTNRLWWSEETFRMLDIIPEQCEASYEGFMKAIHPDDREFVDSTWKTTLKNKEPYDVVYRLLHKDGTVRWMNSIGKTEYDKNGAPLRSMGTTQDITELQNAYEELRVAKERAEESDQLKSSFLANMSHEIRTPMNAVIGFTDLMLLEDSSAQACGAGEGSGGLSETNREYLKTIRNSGRLLLTIISDILDISKIEAGQLNLDCKPFPLRETLTMVKDNARSLQANQGKGNLILDFQCITPLHVDEETNVIEDCLLGDAVRLQQVLYNLLSNAIKFTESGSVECRVKLLTTTKEDTGNDCDTKTKQMLEFCVRDTGLGIPFEKQSDIFKPFQQVHPIKDTHVLGGTGLGLTISRKLVEMMGGEIWLKSRTEGTDQGTVVRFTMPYLPATPKTVLEEEENNTATAGLDSLSERSPIIDTSTSSNCRVLVVDDNIVNLKLAVRIIQKFGYETSTAKNGREAIETLRSDPSIGLILLDKEMPVMDGLATVQEIRRMEREDATAARIPVVALTAAAMTGDKESCLEAGCDDYLTKPIDQMALLKILKSYINQPTV